jgi:hypothetical protein
MTEVRNRRTRKWVIGILLLLLAVPEVVYLVGANLLLRSDFLAQKLNRRPEKFEISWDRAITILPGRVRVSGLRLAGHSPRIGWSMDLEKAVLRVGLLRLFSREFHTSWAVGHGLTLRFEQVEAAGDVDGAVDGEKRPPVAGGNGSADTTGDARPDRPHWTVSLDGLDLTGFRDLTAGRYRLAGDGTLGGYVIYVTRGPLRLDGVTLSFPSLVLTRRGTLVTSGLRLECRLESEAFDPRENRGRRALQFVSGTVSLEGRMAEPVFLNDDLVKAEWLEIQGEEGHVDAELVIDHGAVQPGSRVDYQSDRLAVRVLDNMAEGRGTISAWVTGDGDEVQTGVAVTFEEMAITREGDPSPHIRGSGLRITGLGPEVNLAGELPELEMRVDLAGAEAQDLSLYNDYFPPSADVAFRAGGKCRVDAFLEARGDRCTAGLTLGGKGIGAAVRQVPLEGDLDLEISLSGGRITEMLFDIAETELSLVNVTFPESEEQLEGGWWARAWLEGGTLKWARPFGLDAPVRLEMRDSRPVVALFAEGHRKVRWIRSLLEIENITGRTDLHADQRVVSLTDLELHGEKLEILADLTFVRKKSDGLIFVEFHGFSAATEGCSGDRSWKLFGAREWFTARRGELR